MIMNKQGLNKGESTGEPAGVMKPDGKAGRDSFPTIKIAIAMSGRKVSPHFGQAQEIMLVEVEDGDIKDREVLDSPPRECGALPPLLQSKGVECLITGNIGERAFEKLDKAGIHVYSGAEGAVEDALGSFLSGRLISSEAVCNGEPETDESPGSKGPETGRQAE